MKLFAISCIDSYVLQRAQSSPGQKVKKVRDPFGKWWVMILLHFSKV